MAMGKKIMAKFRKKFIFAYTTAGKGGRGLGGILRDLEWRGDRGWKNSRPPSDKFHLKLPRKARALLKATFPRFLGNS